MSEAMPRCPVPLAVCMATLVAVGGGAAVRAEPVQTAPSPVPRARMDEVLSNMSPHCVRLVETIRGRSAARNARYEDVAPLLNEFRERCAAEQAEAIKRSSERQRREQEQRQAADSALRAERERATLQEQQCAELSRILRGRRERAPSMNDGERADLARFEQIFRERCVRG